MKCINDPSLFSGFFGIAVNRVMTLPAKRGKQSIVAEIATIAPRLVVDVMALRFLTTLTCWMENKICFLFLGILIVFILALGGCIPQPSATLERSF